jgi:hypothetical protein
LLYPYNVFDQANKSPHHHWEGLRKWWAILF